MRKISYGQINFETIIKENLLYIDKKRKKKWSFRTDICIQWRCEIAKREYEKIYCDLCWEKLEVLEEVGWKWIRKIIRFFAKKYLHHVTAKEKNSPNPLHFSKKRSIIPI